MNIFKGARRLSLVVAIGGFGYGLIDAYDRGTSLQVGYLVTPSGKRLVNSYDCPTISDGIHRKRYQTAEGNDFEARICFPGNPVADGRRTFSIPGDKPGTIYFPDTVEGDQAMDAYVSKHFRLSPDDLTHANRAYIAQRSAEVSEKIQNLVIFLTLYLFGTTALGWILRGFLDIPYGSDRKSQGARAKNAI